MKKFFKFAFLNAIAFIGSVFFSACSSSDEIVDNPNYNSETNSVKTELSISISDKQLKTTRQESGYTQATGDLANGIKNMKVIPFNTTPAAGVTKLANPLSLSVLDEFQYTNSNSKIYNDIDVPVGTTHFLFYGESNVSPSDMDGYFRYGKMTIDGLGESGGNPSDISFTPATCYNATNASVGNNLIAALNVVAAASWIDKTVTPNVTHTWATDDALGGVYATFTSLTVGSSFAVEKMFHLLFENLKGTYSTSDMSKAIIDAMAPYTNVSSGVVASGEEFKLIEGLQGYPANVGLPDGAARLKFESGSFSSASTMDAYNPTLNASAFTDYVYPAPLLYFVNTPILTSNAQQSGYYSTKNNWAGVKELYTNGTAVLSTTRSIILDEQINYLVGRLQTTVKADVTAAGKLYDKSGAEITPNFKVTGVIIGGEKPAIWNGDQGSSGAAKTVYDRYMDASTITVTNNTATGSNHTLVLANSADETTVNIAIEFLNNSADFEGSDGIIYLGSKFYIVGQLVLSGTGANNSVVSGGTNPGKIFAQDYVTIANFTIGQGDAAGTATTGLATATNGLPDLRVTQKELGLSVDLDWKPGLQFTVDF